MSETSPPTQRQTVPADVRRRAMAHTAFLADDHLRKVAIDQMQKAILADRASQPASPAIRAALKKSWRDFCENNPDDLTSPEDLPDHALMTCDQFVDYAECALLPQEAEPAPEDLEAVCQECHRPNPVWFAPNRLWNFVMGGEAATDDPGGFLCPCCFIQKAEAQGIRPTGWMLRQEPTAVCDCEHSHNGLGLWGRECDCAERATVASKDTDALRGLEAAAASLSELADEWYCKPAVGNPPSLPASIIEKRLARFHLQMEEAKPAAVAEDWRDDPSADERWNAGLDFGQRQLCKLLGVDPATVSRDAATEELGGDVQSVICNIFSVRFGEDWHDVVQRVPVATHDNDASGLSAPEQKAQGSRCGCRGADDYCPCQNTADRETLLGRAAKDPAA